MKTPKKPTGKPVSNIRDTARNTFSDPGNEEAKNRYLDDDDDDMDDDMDGGLNDFDKFDDLDVDNEDDY